MSIGSDYEAMRYIEAGCGLTRVPASGRPLSASRAAAEKSGKGGQDGGVVGDGRGREGQEGF